MVAATQLLGARRPTQGALILAAATLTGSALVLSFGRLIFGGRPLRIGVTAVLGFANSFIGFNLVMMAAFIAPLRRRTPRLVIDTAVRAGSTSRPAWTELCRNAMAVEEEAFLSDPARSLRRLCTATAYPE